VIQTYSQSTTCYNLLPDYVSAHVMEQVNWEERDAQTLDICRNEQNCTACSDSQILYFFVVYPVYPVWHHHRFCEWYECEVLLDP